MPPLLPIFPLDTVLMPGATLPLHIFEQRYRQLVKDVREGTDSPAFGVVCVRRADAGSAKDLAARPPGAGDSLAAVGTLAAVIRIEPYADGRYDLVTAGRRRFRLLELEPDGAPYLRASVEWLPEEDGDISASLLDRTQRRCNRYLAALGTFIGADPGRIDYASDPVTMSYQVANRIRLSPAERQSLLEAESAEARLRHALMFLRREIVLLPRTRSVPVPASALYVETSLN